MSSEKAELVVTADATNPIAVKFEHVTKEYRLFRNDRQRLLMAITDKVKAKVVLANDDLTFTILRGESVALLGNNGAGKTTALKIISGVAFPTSGRVEVNGRVSAMLNLTAGFNSELTGVENLRQRGHVLGMSNKQIDAMLPGIIDFSELGDFIDQPLRTYSSGMRARLGFAFVSALDPDILILDEVLAVGDQQFKKKSLERMKEIMGRKETTLLFVTHSPGTAAEFCDRGIVFVKGHAVYDGPIAEAIKVHKTGKLPKPKRAQVEATD